MTATTPRDLSTLPKAPEDESWLRGAATIDGAYAAAHALALDILARRSAPSGEDESGPISRTPDSARIAPAGGSAAYSSATSPVGAPTKEVA